MAFCQVKGKRIFYESGGSGPPIVMVHGAGQDTTSWRYNFQAFAQSHRVIAVDLPGHGKSEMVLPPIDSTECFASYLWDFIEELHLKRPILMGHSMGAGICLTVALEHGRKLAGVVAVDGADKVVGVFGGDIHQSYVNAPMELMLEMSMEGFRALCSKSTPSSRVEEIAQDLLRIYPPVTAADTKAFNSFDISDRSRAISAPVLLISGADDFLVTPQMVSETAGRLGGGSKVIFLDGVGHFPHTEAPDRFNREAEEFLASL